MLKKSLDKPILVRQTVQESVVDYLRTLILSGQLPPGQRLIQGELAELLGVSRTPIREALHKLAQEGLVKFSSYKGASVADFSPSELEEIYTVRSALESHAAYLAAQRITQEELEALQTLLEQMEQTFNQGDRSQLLEVHHEFHVAICAAAKQPRLFELAIKHLELTNVYQQMAISLGRGSKDPVGEHKEILEALRHRDADTAENLLRVHLQTTVSELLELFDKKPSQ